MRLTKVWLLHPHKVGINSNDVPRGTYAESDGKGPGAVECAIRYAAPFVLITQRGSTAAIPISNVIAMEGPEFTAPVVPTATPTKRDVGAKA